MQTIALNVTENGFQPHEVHVTAGTPVSLRVTRRTERTCARRLVIEEHGIAQELPLGKTVRIDFTPSVAGTLVYGCAMDKMVAGVIVVA